MTADRDDVPAVRGRHRIDHLDGLRAIAALAVVMQHTVEVSFVTTTEGGWAGWVFQQGFNFGRYGVAVFFLISGFLIPSSIVERPNSLREFAISRFFRLYPLYWVSLAAAVLLLPVIRDQYFPATTVLANITMVQTAFGVPNVIELYWTLFVEMMFYVACAILFATGWLHRRATPLAAVLLLGAIIVASSLILLVPGSERVASPLMKLGTFAMYLQLMFLGQVLRGAADDGSKSGVPLPLAGTVAALAIYCASRQITGAYLPGLTPLGVFAASVAAVATFMASSRIPGLRATWLVYLGAISYGIYLFHPIVSAAVRQVLPYAGTWPLVAALVVSVTLGTIAVSAATYRLIEKPAMAYGSRLRRMLRSEEEPAQQAPLARQRL